MLTATPVAARAQRWFAQLSQQPRAKHAKKKRDCQGEQPRFKTGDLMRIKRPDAKSVPGRFSSGGSKFLADDFAQRHQILGKQADAFG